MISVHFDHFKGGVQSFQSGKSANKHLPHLIDPINYLVQTFDGQMFKGDISPSLMVLLWNGVVHRSLCTECVSFAAFGTGSQTIWPHCVCIRGCCPIKILCSIAETTYSHCFIIPCLMMSCSGLLRRWW